LAGKTSVVDVNRESFGFLAERPGLGADNAPQKRQTLLKRREEVLLGDMGRNFQITLQKLSNDVCAGLASFLTAVRQPSTKNVGVNGEVSFGGSEGLADWHPAAAELLA
tara:strand:+ start:387 stop:713 length:327 start_codon:yes stop_codon:yes gene_type:complete